MVQRSGGWKIGRKKYKDRRSKEDFLPQHRSSQELLPSATLERYQNGSRNVGDTKDIVVRDGHNLDQKNNAFGSRNDGSPRITKWRKQRREVWKFKVKIGRIFHLPSATAETKVTIRSDSITYGSALAQLCYIHITLSRRSDPWHGGNNPHAEHYDVAGYFIMCTAYLVVIVFDPSPQLNNALAGIILAQFCCHIWIVWIACL